MPFVDTSTFADPEGSQVDVRGVSHVERTRSTTIYRGDERARECYTRLLWALQLSCVADQFLGDSLMLKIRQPPHCRPVVVCSIAIHCFVLCQGIA